MWTLFKNIPHIGPILKSYTTVLAPWAQYRTKENADDLDVISNFSNILVVYISGSRDIIIIIYFAQSQQ